MANSGSDQNSVAVQLSSQRIELVSNLQSLLDTSVLQVMNSQRGQSGMPGASKRAKAYSASGTTADPGFCQEERECRVATGKRVVESLNDPRAIALVDALGYTDSLFKV